MDLRAWERTLDEIAAVGPERFGATHFGLHGNVPDRVRQLRERLAAVEARVRRAVAEGDLETRRATSGRCARSWRPPGPGEVDRYFDMFTAATDWAGVKFYVERNP